MADFSRSRKSKNVQVRFAGDWHPADSDAGRMFFEDRKNRQRTDRANEPLDAGEYVARTKKKPK